MSQLTLETGAYDQQTRNFEPVNCQEGICRFWTKAEVRNGQPGILRWEYDCAFVLLARKGLGNYIHTND